MTYEVAKHHWRYDTWRGAWKRAKSESHTKGIPFAVFQTGDCYYVMVWNGVPDYFVSVVEEILGGKFIKRTFILT